MQNKNTDYSAIFNQGLIFPEIPENNANNANNQNKNLLKKIDPIWSLDTRLYDRWIEHDMLSARIETTNIPNFALREIESSKIYSKPHVLGNINLAFHLTQQYPAGGFLNDHTQDISSILGYLLKNYSLNKTEQHQINDSKNQLQNLALLDGNFQLTEIVNILSSNLQNNHTLFGLSIESHAIIVDITKTENELLITVYNSGYSGEEKDFFMPSDYTVSKNGNLKRANAVYFKISTLNHSHSNIVEKLSQSINSNKIVSFYNTLSTLGIYHLSSHKKTMQKSKDCSIECYLSWLHSKLDNKLYYLFKYHLCKRALNTLNHYKFCDNDLGNFFEHVNDMAKLGVETPISNPKKRLLERMDNALYASQNHKKIKPESELFSCQKDVRGAI